MRSGARDPRERFKQRVECHRTWGIIHATPSSVGIRADRIDQGSVDTMESKCEVPQFELRARLGSSRPLSEDKPTVVQNGGDGRIDVHGIRLHSPHPLPIGTEDEKPPWSIVSDPDCVTRQDPQVEGVSEFTRSFSRSAGLTHKATLLIVEPQLLASLVNYRNTAIAQPSGTEYTVQLVLLIALGRANGHGRRNSQYASRLEAFEVIFRNLDPGAVATSDGRLAPCVLGSTRDKEAHGEKRREWC